VKEEKKNGVKIIIYYYVIDFMIKKK